jgi:hypothetical protein
MLPQVRLIEDKKDIPNFRSFIFAKENLLYSNPYFLLLISFNLPSCQKSRFAIFTWAGSVVSTRGQIKVFAFLHLGKFLEQFTEVERSDASANLFSWICGWGGGGLQGGLKNIENNKFSTLKSH